MGHGLDVDLQGVNVAFAAGTGVLPFIDLVGYLARCHLAVKDVLTTFRASPSQSKCSCFGSVYNGGSTTIELKAGRRQI